jgi:hypothetical protein
VATKVWLRKHGLPFTEVAAVTALPFGYRSLPVVVCGDEHWSGFRLNRLLALAHD